MLTDILINCLFQLLSESRLNVFLRAFAMVTYMNNELFIFTKTVPNCVLEVTVKL